MNYYDELITEIKNDIKNNNFDDALQKIKNELSLPYIPSNIEPELHKLLELIPVSSNNTLISDEQIVSYLNGNQSMQLRAVQELDKKNLRDYIDIINDFLTKSDYINAKVLLIESLIRQEISEEINYVKDGISYTFIPKYIRLPEESLGYIKAIELLKDIYMKEPSKFELSKQLLYKECIFALPISFDEEEALILAQKIESYINDAFNNNLA